MGFREKVSLICLAVITFQTACVFSVPPIWSKKDSTKIFQKNNIKRDNKLFNSDSLQSVKTKQPSILKSFNFPDVGYSTGILEKSVRPETILEESPNVKVQDYFEFLNDFRKDKRLKRKYGSLKMPDERPIERINTNKQNYLSQIEAFPQMEFPLTVSETSSPSFWNQLSFPLHDPYFDFDKNIYKPQTLLQSNLMKKGKYATITNTKPKPNNKIDLTPKNTAPLSKKLDVNVLQANDKKFAEMIMPNTTTVSKLETNNDKPEDASENVPKTSKPKRKPKTRKIKIITKSSNVLRDLIAKKSNTSTCSVHNNNSTNDCFLKNQNETSNHAISDVINDRKNTEISDLLSDDFDVCFVNQNPRKTANEDSQICVSFDHDTSIEELLPVSETIKLTKNDSKSLFDELLNHNIKTENNFSVADKSSKIVEKIVLSAVPEVIKQEQIIKDNKETVSPFDNIEIKKILIPTSHNASNEQPTKILSDMHNDEFRKDKPTTTNSSHLVNYELLDEVKETREVDTDIVLSDLEHAIVNSKIDGTFDILIPKIKQAILEAIVESAAFVPSHIAIGFSPSRQNVHYNTNQYDIMNDVEFINIDKEHYIDSPDVISFMKEKYSVPNQTAELTISETSNLTETETNNLQNTLSNDVALENKTEPPPTPPSQNSITSNQDKADVTKNEVVENETLLNYPTSDDILNQNERENQTTYDLHTITDFSNNITDHLANEQLKELKMTNITTIESNTNYTNNEVSNNKIPLVKILLESMKEGDENCHDREKIITKHIDLPSNEESMDNLTVLYVLDTNSEINNARKNNSAISDILDSINGYIISDQDNDIDIEMIKIADVTNNYKLEDICNNGLFVGVFNGLKLKQDNITSTRISSDTLKSNINSPDTKYYNDSEQYSSINTFEQDEQTTQSHNENDLKDINNIYIDKSGWEMKYGEENLFQPLSNSDLEIRILYADDKVTDSEPQVELVDALKIDDNAYIDHSFKDKITGGRWLESKKTTPDNKLISDIDTLSESLSHEIKSNLSLRDHPSLNDELSSDEFTEEILNAILDILCIEDNECNNTISTNNTLHDNLKLEDYEPIKTNNETKNITDGKTILNKDKGVVYKRGPLLGKRQGDNNSPRDFLDKESTGEEHDMASDNKTVDELEYHQENTKDTKEMYPEVSSNNESSTVAIDVTKLELKNTCTVDVADSKDLTKPYKNDSLIDVLSIEKTPDDTQEPNNRTTESMDGKLDESRPSNVKVAENDQNTAIDEILPDNSDGEVR